MIRGWLLYDAECRFCRAIAARLAPVLGRRGFSTAPLQEHWVEARLGGTPADRLTDVRLLLASGTIISGADAYLYLARRIWWAWWFWALFSLPLLNPALHAGYRWVADNRGCAAAGACSTRSAVADSTPSPEDAPAARRLG